MTQETVATPEQEHMIKIHSLLVFFGFARVLEMVSHDEMLCATEELKAEFVTEDQQDEDNDRRGHAFWNRWLSLSQEQRRFLLEMEELRQNPEFMAKAMSTYHPKRGQG